MWISFPQCATPLKMIQKHTLGYLSISTSIRAKRATVNVWSIKDVLLVLLIVFFSLRFVCWCSLSRCPAWDMVFRWIFPHTHPRPLFDPFIVWEKFASYSSSSKSHHCHWKKKKKKKNNQKSEDNSWERCNKATIPSREKNKWKKPYQLYVRHLNSTTRENEKHGESNGLTPHQRRKYLNCMLKRNKVIRSLVIHNCWLVSRLALSQPHHHFVYGQIKIKSNCISRQ